MTAQRPNNVHEIDLLAQDLYDEVHAMIGHLRGQLAGPTPVGTKRMSPREWARKLMSMSPSETYRLLTQLSPESPVFATALEHLGAHGLALLPYLQPNDIMPPPGPPTGFGSEEVF